MAANTPPARPQHLSIASYVSRADSNITNGSFWSGESADSGPVRFSHFPSPPTGFPPTPTHSDAPDSPSTLAHVGLYRSPPETPHIYDFPRTPRTDESAEGKPHVAPPKAAPPTLHRQRSLVDRIPIKLGESSSQMSRPQPGRLRVDTRLQSRPSPIDEVSESAYPRGAPTPSSRETRTPEWNEAASLISVGSTEEGLLSTSFITKLLSDTERRHGTSAGVIASSIAPPLTPHSRTARLESPLVSRSTPQTPHTLSGREPYGPAESHDGHRHVQGSQTMVTYPPALRENQRASSRHSSGASLRPPPPPNYSPSVHSSHHQPSLHGSDVAEVTNRGSGNYSDTLISDLDSEHQIQIQSVVRMNSLSNTRRLKAARVVGVAPAYTVESVADWKHRSPECLSPSSPTHSPVPTHSPEVPHSVTGHTDLTHAENANEEYDGMLYLKASDFPADLPHRSFSPALPSTAGTVNERFDDAPRRHSSRRRRKSVVSMKSYVSSLVSRVSRSTTGSLRHSSRLAWLQKRPLPPLPPLPNPAPHPHFDEEVRKSEEGTPLPVLMQRAGDLVDILDKHGTMSRRGLEPGLDKEYGHGWEADATVSDYENYIRRTVRSSGLVPGFLSPNRSLHQQLYQHDGLGQDTTLVGPGPPNSKVRPVRWPVSMRIVIVGLCLLVLLLIGVGVGVGLSVSRKHTQPSCLGNFTGAACDIDSTCVCTSLVPGQCNQLAQALVALIPTVNSLFTANFTPSSLSAAVWVAQGSPVGPLCTEQAQVIDVAPGLDRSMSPNRTQWAQAAILWNLALSADVSATSALRTFVSTAAWSSFPTRDGPAADVMGKFTTIQSGYRFDFAAQVVSPPSVAFDTDSQVTDEQVAKLSDTAKISLNRMYAFALASSSQRQKSLINYWQGVLQQDVGDLPKFMAAVRSSAFFLPFDATSSPGGTPFSSLLTTSTTTPFPPPLACYPSLSGSQLRDLNALETGVFGLQAASAPSKFDQTCFPDRPIYGVVDLLRLRLPYRDGRAGVGKQAAILTLDALPRTVIYNGEVLSAFPGAAITPPLTPATTDPRQFGTSNHLNHVVLNYLSSINNFTLAMELVDYVLKGPSGPPSNSSDLFGSLSSLPLLEFAIFGSVTPADITSSVSAFSAPSGSLFFGSPQAQAFRTWALVNTAQTIAWTEFATSSLVVREGSTTDPTFESVWTPASQLIQQGSLSPDDVGKVTGAFTSLGKFSP